MKATACGDAMRKRKGESKYQEPPGATLSISKVQRPMAAADPVNCGYQGIRRQVA